MNSRSIDWRATTITAALHGGVQLAGLGCALLIAYSISWQSPAALAALVGVVFLLPLSTRVLARAILGLPHPLELWRAWAVILFCFIVAVSGEGFAEAGLGPWHWAAAMGIAGLFGGMASSWPQAGGTREP